MTLGREILAALAVFAVVTAAAATLGATNSGTALAFGQIGFAGAVTYLLLAD